MIPLRNQSPVPRVLVFTMPDEGTPIDFALWLETRLTAPDFHQLAAELESVQDYVHEGVDDDNPRSIPTLENVLGEHLAEVLEKGLTVIAVNEQKEKLHLLYSNTTALHELHFRIYADGGEYWQKKIESAASNDAAKKPSQTNFLENVVAATKEEAAMVFAKGQKTPVVEQPTVSLASRNQSWILPALVSSICSAAAVFALMFAFPREPSRTEYACQWSVAELSRSPNSKDFFRKATFLATWPEEPPKDAAALAKEIAHYRTACSELIMADFQVLTAEERKYFREKCLAWSKKFDAQLLKIETEGDAAVREVHVAVGDIIIQLKKTLKDRINSVG